MRSTYLIGIIIAGSSLLPDTQSSAQVILATLIKAVVTKAIRAADLTIQREQIQTIEAETAQKLLENVMAQSRLAAITSWVDKEQNLYHSYYRELRQVKNAIGGSARVRQSIGEGTRMLSDYQHYLSLFSRDPNISAAELKDISVIYSGMIAASTRDLAQLELIITNFSTQMTDGRRLKMVDAATQRIGQDYNDLEEFDQQNLLLSLQWARTINNLNMLSQLYGRQN